MIPLEIENILLLFVKNKLIKFFIIIKNNSERLPNKNFLKINNIPLFHYLLNELKSENVYIDTDSKKIINNKYFNNLRNFTIYERKQEHIKLETSKKFKISPVNILINNFIDNYCDLNDTIVCSHVTSPFIKKKTIYEAIDYLNKGYSSVSAATYHQEFGILKKQNNYENINFKNNIVNKTQDLNPILLLNGAFFIFKAKTFKKFKTRYSNKHFYFEIKYPESIDINYKEDLKLAKNYAKSK